MAKPLVRTEADREVLSNLVKNINYEVIPFKSVTKRVRNEVPLEVPLTVTATGSKGLEPTMEISITLRKQGYEVAPHLPARLIVDSEELDALATRLEVAGVDRIFVIGGDAEDPAGEFSDALGLLEALKDRGHRFTQVAVAGHPEGHAFVPQKVMDRALIDKAAHANRILTQICFDADAVTSWGSRIRGLGVELPVFAGMPGPVSRQKLMRISAGLGLGASANFLKKQQNMFWRFFSPSGYRPNKLIQGLIQNLSRASESPAVEGFHIFTFNDLANTEAWRQELIAQLDA